MKVKPLTSIDDERFGDESVYNSQFLEEVNTFSNEVNYSSDYINEIFLYFCIPLFEKKSVSSIKSKKGLSSGLIGSDNFRSAVLSSSSQTPLHSTYYYLKSLLLLLWALIVVISYSLLLPMYTIFRYRNIISIELPLLAVVRAPASYQKMSFLQKKGVIFLADSLAFNDCEVSSLYTAVALFKKIQSLVYVPIYSLLDFLKIYRDVKKTIGFIWAGDALMYFSKRIIHKCNFEFYLQSLFKRGCGSEGYYTGNKEDRFALLEKRLCKRYGIQCVCIPHGLEYSYKMPGGLVGDDFYCTSNNAKNYLSKLYGEQTVNFHFDEKVAAKMFSREVKKNKERVIVFFPESREPEVNLKIMKFLVAEGFKLHVKLHVKDSVENYLPVLDRIEIIELFDEAISNNICLARKSTVLVEALYNNSIAISVLIDNRDKSYVNLMFPSLVDPKILRAETFLQLKKELTDIKEEGLDV